MSVVAAWRMFGYLHDVPGSSTTHLDFRRKVAVCLLKMVGERSSVAGGRHAQMPVDVRYDGDGHRNK